MITYQEALAKFLGAARVQVATEAVPTLYAEGRTLARDVVSAINVPDFDNSQMDGYCIKSSDIAMATADSPVALPVVDRIPAGTNGRPLAAGTCARIFTGAPMPEGADTVVPQEDVALAADGAVRFSRPAPCGAWVRRRAGDVAEGSVVARKGDLL
ncbi:MAG: molybdopterin molybdenumtransferase MoeA, partial [Duodenibacillus sp.]|nr:molybdopterin molybdenumtransferase MoeA [Duodenibacillus sp.]